MAKDYKGGCLCGNIRFTATGKPLNPHTCSCTMCQRHSGSLSQVWVEFERQQVIWDGPGGKPKLWRSSEYSSRSFCNECGSTLGAIDDAPIIALVVGAFDTPNRLELMPKSHSYVSKKPKWWHVEVTP
ncbi:MULTISPECIES: GFA family protein [Pseudoalteromonas]|uniref:GFA family protein n=1 Tax=Pseudoalteromonas obscura TaxID=3048491 RepID=A0ABT7EJ19_9GAMM|nr:MULTISPECIES: GFA family protein [Pseudoalteromonas]MBQ4836580.1 GFA family protein [Pseudoalteromonas luteoviolacea]MDK2595007.1 GFA family protein [Pseudoalteromonas sp. P94(2023)]